MKKTTSGFTIVELLIVIVVIAILAAITIVAYNGIQNRAYDSAIQSDLRQTAGRLEAYKIDNPSDRYPANSSEVEAMGLRATKTAYWTDNDLNLTYCVGSGGVTYALAARSKSGKSFYIVPGSNVQSSAATNVDNCIVGGLTRTVSAWWFSGAGGWRSWIQG